MSHFREAVSIALKSKNLYQMTYPFLLLIIKMSFADWLGDLILRILDEIKFWGEVITAFMEWDE
jgi:hypothetical protein